MGVAVKLRSGIAILLLTGTVSISVAQEGIVPARQFKLELSEQFSATENQAQDADSAGVTTSAVTRFGLEAITINELNQFRLQASTAFRLSDRAEGSSVSEFDQPRFDLRYQRTGATSNLSVTADYRRDDISFLRPLDDFTDDLGNVVVPDDADDLRGTGTRIDYGSTVRLQLRQDAPISLGFELGFDRREYQDVTDPDLTDTETLTGRTTVGFRFAPDFEGQLSYGVSQFTDDDVENTQRDRQNISFSLEKSLSKVLTGRLTIGRSRVETTTNTGGSDVVTGANGGLALSLARPNGSIGLTFDNTTNANGTRQELALQRSFLLRRDGTLSGSIGTTRLEDGDRQSVGSLQYNQILPTGSMNFAFNQTVRFVEEDGADRDIQTLTAAYSYTINNLSSISFRAATTESDDTDRASFGVTYSYSLTEDWSLSTGYSFDRLTEDDGENGDRHRIFLGVSRSFDLPF